MELSVICLMAFYIVKKGLIREDGKLLKGVV
jgi:hypothetical protein